MLTRGAFSPATRAAYHAILLFSAGRVLQCAPIMKGSPRRCGSHSLGARQQWPGVWRQRPSEKSRPRRLTRLGPWGSTRGHATEERLRVDPQPSHQVKIPTPTVIVVARHRGTNIRNRAWALTECVPDRWTPPVGRDCTFNLEARCGDSPAEPIGKLERWLSGCPGSSWGRIWGQRGLNRRRQPSQ